MPTRRGTGTDAGTQAVTRGHPDGRAASSRGSRRSATSTGSRRGWGTADGDRGADHSRRTAGRRTAGRRTAGRRTAGRRTGGDGGDRGRAGLRQPSGPAGGTGTEEL